MKLLDILQNRHSIRTYTNQPIPDDDIQTIINSGLLSASSRAIRPWELIVIKDKETLQKLALCRTGAAKMLENADAAIVVIADDSLSDVWIEDCSIVMSNMHLMADSLNIGSCWIQGRLREASDGQTTEDYVRSLLNIPGNFRLEAILSLGMPAQHIAKTKLSELNYSKVHYETFTNK